MSAQFFGSLWRGAGAAALFAAALSAAPAAAEDKAAMLLPGSINDQSWNALGYSILLSLKSHGFMTAYTENVTDADEGEAMRDFASQGYKIVMGHSGRFVSAMEQVAPKFPNTQFIAVSGNEGQAPNVMSIDWNNAQFGCQLGVLAAHMSKTHKVAGVYGLEGVPNITAQAGGFRICATKAGAAVTILYVKDMEDAAAAKEAALSLDRAGRRRPHRQVECCRGGPRRGGEGEARLRHRPRLRSDQDRARSRLDQHPRGLARHVRQHRRPSQSRQAVRNVRPIRLRHPAGDGRHADVRGRQAVQSDRARRRRRPSCRTWRRNSLPAR